MEGTAVRISRSTSGSRPAPTGAGTFCSMMAVSGTACATRLKNSICDCAVLRSGGTAIIRAAAPPFAAVWARRTVTSASVCETPATSGTRPSISSSTTSVSMARSSVVNCPNSLATPGYVMPSTPAVTRYRTRLRRLTTSGLPSSRNGVGNTGKTPARLVWAIVIVISCSPR
jgi:hypothetical protein